MLIFVLGKFLPVDEFSGLTAYIIPLSAHLPVMDAYFFFYKLTVQMVRRSAAHADI